jgi:hypothetical protein
MVGRRAARRLTDRGGRCRGTGASRTARRRADQRRPVHPGQRAHWNTRHRGRAGHLRPGSTMVSTFQVGRVFNGGATDIGWATSTNGASRGRMASCRGRAGRRYSPARSSPSVTRRSPTTPVTERGSFPGWAHTSLAGGIVAVLVSRSTDGGNASRDSLDVDAVVAELREIAGSRADLHGNGRSRA